MEQKIISNNINTYRRIRSAIGYLGFLLPIVLVLLSLVDYFHTDIRSSISHYYYTNFRDIFTGVLCAVGFFMIRYKGLGNKVWYKNDNLLTNIAGVTAILVAFLPTIPEAGDIKPNTLINSDTGVLHYVAASILFISFSILSIFVFTIGQEENNDLPVSRLNENHIYKFCGYAILLFIVLIFILGKLHVKYSTLILEFLSLLAFGISWLIKGRALGDKGRVGKVLYRENN